jgi:uroporphyrinogen-III synthase
VNPALDGVTVVVTRPAAQSARFMELARAAGATCVAYPTLQIERLSLPPATLALLQGRRWDWAIFTSANAVAATIESLVQPLARKQAAVGRATARALEHAGMQVDARPGNATSEGLLQLPEFTADIAGKGVLLVKGRGGRDLLAPSLRARGAEVIELDVYRRVAVAPAAAAAAALHDALARSGGVGQPRVVVTVTSAEILQSLLDHVAAADSAPLQQCLLLVPGSRVAAEASRLGWTGPIVQAKTAEDEAMFDALSQLAAGPLPAA